MTEKEHPELDFGAFVKCLKPGCNQQIPVRQESVYCSHKCRKEHNVNRFIDYGEIDA